MYVVIINFNYTVGFCLGISFNGYFGWSDDILIIHGIITAWGAVLIWVLCPRSK